MMMRNYLVQNFRVSTSGGAAKTEAKNKKRGEAAVGSSTHRRNSQTTTRSTAQKKKRDHRRVSSCSTDSGGSSSNSSTSEEEFNSSGGSFSIEEDDVVTSSSDEHQSKSDSSQSENNSSNNSNNLNNNSSSSINSKVFVQRNGQASLASVSGSEREVSHHSSSSASTSLKTAKSSSASSYKVAEDTSLALIVKKDGRLSHSVNVFPLLLQSSGVPYERWKQIHQQVKNELAPTVRQARDLQERTFQTLRGYIPEIYSLLSGGESYEEKRTLFAASNLCQNAIMKATNVVSKANYLLQEYGIVAEIEYQTTIESWTKEMKLLPTTTLNGRPSLSGDDDDNNKGFEFVLPAGIRLSSYKKRGGGGRTGTTGATVGLWRRSLALFGGGGGSGSSGPPTSINRKQSPLSSATVGINNTRIRRASDPVRMTYNNKRGGAVYNNSNVKNNNSGSGYRRSMTAPTHSSATASAATTTLRRSSRRLSAPSLAHHFSSRKYDLVGDD